ncbi:MULTISPECIES: S1 family peptidase [Mycobacteroides]|uniref:S1 family peptidase n=1 Tax=Mycobacteroides TaxID=670516 RepID=UPI000A9343AE|nr:MULTISPECIES: S1 family peptidase [Mycobacteroides]
MCKRRFALTAIAALAAVGVSACSTTGVAGEAVPAADSAITQKAATLAPAAPRYIDVSGKVVVPRDSYGSQYGAQPYPGIAIGQHQSDGSTKDCTLGPLVTGARGKGFITAGHCDQTPGGEVFVFADTDAAKPVSIGVITGAEDKPTPQGYSDSAVIWTGNVDSSATKIAGRWPVVGVMTASEVRRLPVGTPICINGAWSGVVCSPLIAADDQYVRTPRLAQGGDSGAAVFVVDQKGEARLVGIHSGFENGQDEATFLEPALQRLGATALTAP